MCVYVYGFTTYEKAKHMSETELSVFHKLSNLILWWFSDEGVFHIYLIKKLVLSKWLNRDLNRDLSFSKDLNISTNSSFLLQKRYSPNFLLLSTNNFIWVHQKNKKDLSGNSENMRPHINLWKFYEQTGN